MKAAGYLLITLGFMAGSYFAVIDTVEVPWNWVLPCLAVALAGVALVQLAIRRDREVTEEVHASLGRLEESLSRIVDNAATMDGEKETLDVYDVHRRIDELFMADIDTFVDGRERIAHAYGLQSYADIMTLFATGERYLNRCWSASADGYIDEVKTFLARAHEQFEQALARLREERRRAAG